MKPADELLRRWAEASLRDVELPSGLEVRVRLPGIATLLREGRIPSELRAIALRFAGDGIDPAKLATEEDLAEFAAFSDTMAAATLAEIRIDDAWYPVELTADDLRTHRIDEQDREALAAIALRGRTPKQVTARSRFDRGLLDALTLQRAITQEAAATVTGFATFPGESGGAAAGEAGDRVGAEPEPAAGDRG